jgi:hypothetical protein
MRIHKYPGPGHDKWFIMWLSKVLGTGTSFPRIVPTLDARPSNQWTKLQRTFSCNEDRIYFLYTLNHLISCPTESMLCFLKRNPSGVTETNSWRTLSRGM